MSLLDIYRFVSRFLYNFFVLKMPILRKRRTELSLRVISAHVDVVLPSLTKLLEEAYTVTREKEIRALMNSATVLTIEDSLFVTFFQKFLEHFKTLCGIRVYNSFVYIWGNEESFLQYVVTWTFIRVSTELLVSIANKVGQTTIEGGE